MPIRLEYTVGAELPDTHITWRDSSGNLIDFLTGHTFQLRINTTPTTTIKSTGITGAATDPNITIQFTTGELAAIAPAQYIAQLWANRTADNRDRVLPLSIRIVPAVT